ncbi:MAG: NADH-quinone oxidoreductase subunit I [Candidatus Woesearchaeota archaeon]|nr:NADH-quinone oxidoreductase subunit I [Candidatus Woesearchaeota archaeon]
MLRALWATFVNSLRSPPTEMYPTKRYTLPERYRGKHIFFDELCIGCSLCEKACPNNTIVMLERPEQTDPKLKHRPIIDLNRCIFCGYCAEICPAKCLFMGKGFEMAGKTKAELLFTYRGMIESPGAADNERVIYPELEGENALDALEEAK